MALPIPICPAVVQGSKPRRAKSCTHTVRETVPAQQSLLLEEAGEKGNIIIPL